jgi:hypothetical protein
MRSSSKKIISKSPVICNGALTCILGTSERPPSIKAAPWDDKDRATLAYCEHAMPHEHNFSNCECVRICSLLRLNEPRRCLKIKEVKDEREEETIHMRGVSS